MIEIGPMSGMSNVAFYLQSRGLPADGAVADEVLKAAKKSDTTLTEEQVLNIVRSHDSV